MNNVNLENLQKYRVPLRLSSDPNHYNKSFNFDECFTVRCEEIKIKLHKQNFFTTLKPFISYLKSNEKLNPRRKDLKYIESYFSILVKGNNFSCMSSFYENDSLDHFFYEDNHLDRFSHKAPKDEKVKKFLNIHHGYNYKKEIEPQTNLKNLYKYCYPFKLEFEYDFSPKDCKDNFIIQTYRIKNMDIKGETSFKFFLEQTIAFIKYLQSKRITENKRKFYIKSNYSINTINSLAGIENLLEYEYIEGELNLKSNKIFKYLYKEYSNIELEVSHIYKNMEVLDHCPPNSFKIDQCVICLTEPPNILYNPCCHICVCSQCNKEELGTCPYCRKKIENRILIN